jgi:hypothetical protein
MFRSFVDEMAKIADIEFGEGPVNARKLVAGGIFIGADSDHGKKTQEITKHLEALGSLRKAREAYQKDHPSDFVTGAWRLEAPPSGVAHKLKSLFGSAAAKSLQKSYEDRVKNPRIFVRVAPSGSSGQSMFYDEVARGYYDSELDQPHIPKEDRWVAA